jgi:hypothetical protein
MSTLGTLSREDIEQLQASFGDEVTGSDGGMALMGAFGLGYRSFPNGGKRQRAVRKRREKVLTTLLRNKPLIRGAARKVFDASDPSVRGEKPSDEDVRMVHDLFAGEAERQLRKVGVAPAGSGPNALQREFNTSRIEASITEGLEATVVGAAPPPGSPATPVLPATPDSTLDLADPSVVTGSLFETPGPPVVEPVFGDESEPAPAPDPPSDEPAVEPVAETTTTPSGDQVVEQLQQSMTTSSELVEKAANAVDASAKATTMLQKTVEDTTGALKALTEAKTKTETASPALSQQVMAQIQADPAIAKLVSDGLLKWDDLLGKNPEPGKEGHVAGVAVGDPVVLPGKLQTVIDNLQTARVRESASLTGAIEVNRAARTTTGFRPSDTGYFPGRQVWMPIRAPPPSLPGRR